MYEAGSKIRSNLCVRNGVYCGQVTITEPCGKRHTKERNFHVPVCGGKRKADGMLEEFTDEWKQAIREDINYCEQTFIQFLTEWLETTHKSTIETATYRGYLSYIEIHLKPFYREKKLNALQPSDLQDFINGKISTGITASTARKIHFLVKCCLQYAVNLNIIPYNPADRITLPRIEKYQASFLAPEQAKHLLEICQGEPLETPIKLALLCGLRRSEVLGLKWSAVDLDNNCINICNTITTTGGRIEKNRTKNQSSMRTLCISFELRDYLLKLKQHSISEYVCTDPDGTAMHPDHITVGFPKFLRTHNLPVVRFHDLRHSCASILINLGASAKQVSELLGHCDVSTTLNIYTHNFAESKKQLADSLQNALS
ncbi:MAG: site-specific integrase [Oscillospiraceae bacterium]|jgi:integrase|nr:site-specific integrase [Oscillospiraceae bacterium]